MIQERKPDRRIQRTRQLLREALMELIVEKGYDAITLQEIADRANVARTTFYLHFKDKDDLLFSTMRDLYEDLVESIKTDCKDNPLGVPYDLETAADYEHVAQYADFYRVMLSERGSMSFFLRVQSFIAVYFHEIIRALLPPGETPHVPLEMIAYSMAGSQIAAIKWWLDHDLEHTPDQMALMTQQLAFHGVTWALGQPISLPDESAL